MRVLLINPPYIHRNNHDPRMASLSLLYLASSLQSHNHEVEIYDASSGSTLKSGKVFRYGAAKEEIHNYLRERRFDIAGITCCFGSQWNSLAEIARMAKVTHPGCKVVTGGMFPTYSWKYCLEKCAELDFILLGEAELTLSQAVNNLSDGKNIDGACKDIDGAAWRRQGNISCNPKKIFNEQLDNLPFPAWSLLDLERQFGQEKRFYDLRPPYFTVLSSRGCPHNCSFCNMYVTQGRKWRGRSPKNFVDELQFYKEKYNVDNFFIADDNFSFDIGRAKDICREILKRSLSIHYNLGNGISAKRVDRQLLQLMKESGCGSICFAIESGSDRIRNQVYKKNLSREQIYQSIKWCNEIGLSCTGFFMVGAPGEDRRSINETKMMLKKIGLTLCTCGIYTPYPQTPLYDYCLEQGYLQEGGYSREERADFTESILATPEFSAKKVKNWQREIYLYFIIWQWPRLLKELIKTRGVISIFDLAMLKNLLNIKDWFRLSKRGTRVSPEVPENNR